MATKTGLVITALTRNGADTFVNATIKSGGDLRLSGTAQAQDATVNDGGQLHLLSAAGASGTTAVKNGGRVYVSSGGKLLGKTNIAAGGNALVYSGGTVENAYVFGTLRTFGGVTTADIKSGGYLRLEKGIATGVTVRSGAKENISAGAEDLGASVFGELQVRGTATNTLVKNGGTLKAYGGSVVNATVSNGGIMYLKEKSEATGVIVQKGGVAVVETGTKDEESEVKGEMRVYGTTDRAIVRNGGSLILRNDGTGSRIVATGVHIKSGGTEFVSKGAIDTDAVISGGTQSVLAGGKAVDASVRFGGVQKVLGTAQGTKVYVGSVQLQKGGALTGTTSLTKEGAVLRVTGLGASANKITAAAGAEIRFDVTGLKAGQESAMLTYGNGQKIANAGYAVATKVSQQTGTYKLSSQLSVDKGTSFAIRSGDTALTTVSVNGAVRTYKGMKYSVKSEEGVVSLRLAVDKSAELKVGKSANEETVTGTVKSDIFYGGKGKDTIDGKYGRDVAVYDKDTAWGQDTIKATNGTMTILMIGLTKDDVTLTDNGTTKTITRKGTSQNITVKGWSDDTHNIVYNSSLASYSPYLAAAATTQLSPEQTAKVQNAVFKAAGLATS